MFNTNMNATEVSSRSASMAQGIINNIIANVKKGLTSDEVIETAKQQVERSKDFCLVLHDKETIVRGMHQEADKMYFDGVLSLDVYSLVYSLDEA